MFAWGAIFLLKMESFIYKNPNLANPISTFHPPAGHGFDIKLTKLPV